jgi:predicted CopG family antitoxin
MTITIGISEEVWKKLNDMKKPGQSFEEILRKKLKIKQKEKK